MNEEAIASEEIQRVDASWLTKWNRAVPRYTSYPTAPQFTALEQSTVLERLAAFDQTDKPLSLYFHIPFCKKMCLFCGCSVVLNRNPERQNRYLHHLLQEISLISSKFSKKRKVAQLHLGGGTPTSLTLAEFELLMDAIHQQFAIIPGAEISIEVDPRTVYSDGGEKLAALKRLGFNRISFGVQDLDPRVQEAVKRNQTEEMTIRTFERAKEIGFEGINIDLIYGLPEQNRKSFGKTASTLAALKPDRIAFYSYAKVPWLKPHQKAIPEESLPSTEEKFAIYVEARELFMNHGYLPIGMDHFSLAADSLAQAYKMKKLTRNFQGYSIQLAEDMLGFGITSIGFLENSYLQNIKEIEPYEASIARGEIPIAKGFILQPEDILRRWVIQSIMCQFEIDKEVFSEKFKVPFDLHFSDLRTELDSWQKEGFLKEEKNKIIATPLGRLFVRLIAASFDAYLEKGNYSRAV